MDTGKNTGNKSDIKGVLVGVWGALAWAATAWGTVAGAAGPIPTVEQIVQAVRQAYPQPRALCSGGPELVRSAVTEAMPGVALTNAQTKGVADAATQRLLASCR